MTEPRVQYEVVIRVPSRKLMSQVGKLEDDLNRTMNGFGFADKVGLTTEVPNTLTVARPLTDDEREGVTKIVLDEFRKQFGETCEVVSFNRTLGTK